MGPHLKMSNGDLNQEVAEFLYREALLLDERKWQDWLELYAEDAVFWVPSYTMEGEVVADPELSVNLMYVSSQSGLEDRIFRLSTEESFASSPLPRTCHMISNVLAHETEGGTVHATAAFNVACWSNQRGPENRVGRYEYHLRRDSDDYHIGRKKVLLVDEVIDGWFDFFSI